MNSQGLFLLFLLACCGIQADLIIQHDFAKLVNYDSSFIQFKSFNFYKKKRDLAALNVSYQIFQDVTSDSQMKMNIAGLQFRGNEFKKTVIDFSLGICTLYRANKFDALKVVNNSNLIGCPFKKGFYYINDISPDADFLPPFFPEGKWLLDFTFYFYKKVVVHIQWMMTLMKKV